VADIFSVVDSINDPVSVVLHSCCEYNNFVEVGELRKKSIAIWSDHVKEIILTFF
jgi:hypothetical protein